MRNLKPFVISSFFGIIACAVMTTSYADQDVISLFPLDNYDQTVSTWIKPTDADFDKVLLNADMQQKHLHIFYEHYFGSQSPWSAEYVNQVLKHSSPDDLQSTEQNVIHDFSNEGKPDNKIGYGENFRPHSSEWITDIANNVNAAQFDGLSYQADHRGIAIDNLHARVLPTEDVSFYSHKLAGEGYPFDNLQMSALWVGTPVYIVGEARDHAWLLVITPDYIAWVKSTGIARTDNAFVNTWTSAAKNKLAAVTHTQTSIMDDKSKFLFSAYVGAVFPSKGTQLMVPVADDNHNAVIKNAMITSDSIASMPIAVTAHQFSNLMKTMINRPYGWGSMYFYNE
jgi:hypothetical protein